MFIKKIVPVCLAMTIFSLTASAQMGAEIADNEDIEAGAAIVCEISTGRVLYAHNIDEKLPMASTTKIMTTLIALDQPNLEDYFTVDANAIDVEGSSMGLKDGDRVNFMSLLYGMLLPSGNDAANVVAVKIGGSAKKFADIMNERAEELGLNNTHFVTPSGLDDPEHYTTAFDLARLTAVAMENPLFRQICSLSDAEVSFGNPPKNRWLKNHNKLLKQDERCIGVKTGFTYDAGRCLVSAAKNSDGEELIVVTLKAVDDWSIHKNFFDEYFDKMDMQDFSEIEKELKVPIVGADKDYIDIAANGELKIPVLKGEEKNVRHKVYLKKFDYAPVAKGDYMGKIEFYVGDSLICTKDLVANESIKAQQ